MSGAIIQWFTRSPIVCTDYLVLYKLIKKWFTQIAESWKLKFLRLDTFFVGFRCHVSLPSKHIALFECRLSVHNHIMGFILKWLGFFFLLGWCFLFCLAYPWSGWLVMVDLPGYGVLSIQKEEISRFIITWKELGEHDDVQHGIIPYCLY